MRCILRTVGAGVLDSPAVQSNNRKKVRRIPSSCEIAEPFCCVPICCRATLVVARFASRSRHGFASRNGEEGKPPLPKGGWPELARVGGIRLRPCHPEEAQPTKDPDDLWQGCTFLLLVQKKGTKENDTREGKISGFSPSLDPPSLKRPKGACEPLLEFPGVSGKR